MAVQADRRPMAGGPLVGESGSVVSTYPAGRVCAFDGCDTQLSRYNPDDQCALHKYPEGTKYKRLTH